MVPFAAVMGAPRELALEAPLTLLSVLTLNPPF
jgi:hypothetical protein